MDERDDWIESLEPSYNRATISFNWARRAQGQNPLMPPESTQSNLKNNLFHLLISFAHFTANSIGTSNPRPLLPRSSFLKVCSDIERNEMQLRRVLILTLLLSICAPLAQAQDDERKLEVFVGFSALAAQNALTNKDIKTFDGLTPAQIREL